MESDSGEVRARSAGSAVIAAAAGGLTAVDTLPVVPPPTPASVTIMNPLDTPLAEDSTRLDAVVLSAARDTLSSSLAGWTSSDTTVAVVNDSGPVPARRVAGATVITATAGAASANARGSRGPARASAGQRGPARASAGVRNRCGYGSRS